MSKSWTGEAEFSAAMHALNDQRPPSLSLIRNVVAIALKHVNDFKMVVFDVEKWMKKSNLPDRIAGIYVIDSICRTNRPKDSPKDKVRELYSTRFSSRLNEIFMLLNGVPDSDIKSLLRVVDEWIKWDVFQLEKLQLALRGIKSPSVRIPTAQSAIQNSEANASTEFGSYNSSLSDAKPNGEATELTSISKSDFLEQIGKRKQVKYCAFRDNSCPYGDKCRFSHANDGKPYLPTSSKRSRVNRLISYSSANYLLNDALAYQLLPANQILTYMKSAQQANGARSVNILDNQIIRVPLFGDGVVLEYDGKPIELSDQNKSLLEIRVSDEEQFRKLYS